MKNTNKAKNEFINDFLNNIKSCVIVCQASAGGKDFIFKDINKAVEKTEGIRKEEVVGKHLTEIFFAAKDVGLIDIMRRVWKSGSPENFPETFCNFCVFQKEGNSAVKS